jgi:predicted anti-sigma-YlaC factor YlaD
MSCDAYRELLSGYLEESLDEVRRTAFRAHLRSCTGCREYALAEEPTLIFALGERPEPDPARIEECVTAVVTGIRQDRLQRRLRPSRRPWFAAAAAAMVAVFAASVWWVSSGSGVAGDPQIVDAGGVAVVEQPVPEQLQEVVEPPPRIEVDMKQDEVRVYQYAIEDDSAMSAVFIVNPAMEL